MPTLETAMKKWARKMKTAGTRWKKGVTDKTDAFAKGLARFLGLPDISDAKKTAWSEGVGSITAEDFARAVSGKEEKWARRLKEAFAP